MSEGEQGTPAAPTTAPTRWQGPITDSEERSAVAAFIEQWNLEAAAIRQGLSGYAEGTARHDFIDKRIKALGNRCQPYFATIDALQQQTQKDAVNSSTTTTA